jgi:soluble lytic murein transglycosylase
LSIVHSIARQESGFTKALISPAQVYGADAGDAGRNVCKRAGIIDLNWIKTDSMLKKWIERFGDPRDPKVDAVDRG